MDKKASSGMTVLLGLRAILSKHRLITGEDNRIQKIVFGDGLYCLERQRQKKTIFIPIDPQPAEDAVMTVRR